jgi:RHS repeat-associated protein
MEPETGLVYLRARWYNPSLGRFITIDGFEGIHENPLTLNKYLGFSDNPLNFFDPTGAISIDAEGKVKTNNRLLALAMPRSFDAGIFLEPFDTDKGKIQRVLIAENRDANQRYPQGMKAVGKLIDNQLYGGRLHKSSFAEVLQTGKFSGYPYGNVGESNPNADKPFWADLTIANDFKDSRRCHYADYIETASAVSDQVLNNSLPEPFPLSTVYFMWAQGFTPNKQADNINLYLIGIEAGNLFYGYEKDRPK